MVAETLLLNCLLCKNITRAKENLRVVSKARQSGLPKTHTAVVRDCVSNGLDFRAP